MTAARRNIRPLTPQVAAEIVTVTPQLAEQWLSGNTVNRKIRIAKVNDYASDMLAGRWTISEAAICFAPDGKLLNGQHRLTAVVASGVAVPMLVMRNVPLAAMGNMDSGVKRSAADQLGFDGEKNAAALASAVRLAILYTDGRIYKDRKIQGTTNGELREFVADNPDLRDSVAFIYAHAGTVDLTPTAKIVAHWIFARTTTSDEANLFFELLASRTDLPAGSPILALDSRLREIRKSRVRLTHREELYLLVKAWNYWRLGRQVRSIAVRTKAADLRIPAVAR